MNEVMMLVGMFIVTFGVRYILFAVADNIRFPHTLKRALNYVPIAVLTAIIFPAVFLPKGAFFFSLDNPYIFGAVVAVMISLWRKNMLLTVVVGLAAFALYKFIVL